MKFFSTDYKGTNLLEETLELLKDNGKDQSDIEWVGIKDYFFDKEEFFKVASQTNYDSGFGSNEINSNLIIVGSDWWMGRGEYDGSEWWEFHIKPTKPEKLVTLTDQKQIKEDYT